MEELALKNKLQEMLVNRFSEYSEFKFQGSSFRIKPLLSDYPKISFVKYDKEKDELKIIFTNNSENITQETLTSDVDMLLKEGKAVGFSIKNFALELSKGFKKAILDIKLRIDSQDNSNQQFSSISNLIIENRKLSFLSQDILNNKNLKELVS